jgi:hypothetical protein
MLKLMISTQNDYGLGFSVVPSVREAAEKKLWRMLVRGAAFVFLLGTGAVI